MRVAVTGSRGLIGSALVAALEAGGDEVTRVVRGHPGHANVAWDPAKGTIGAEGLEGVDAVVHLAGESIAAGRWTQARKDAIRRSRVDGTRLLAETLTRLEHRPRLLLSASAVGYYGSRGDEPLTEESPPGTGFLAEVCRAWEAAARPAGDAGIRVVTPRFGMVLAREGGALPRMLTPFRLGLGGVIGSGAQYVSWIALPDLVALLRFLMGADGLAGPVNAVAPRPVTNREFTKALGRVLGRPTVVPVPPFVVRLVFGEMGEAVLLGGQRVLPARLETAGFRFRTPDLEAALTSALRPAREGSGDGPDPGRGR
jgi:uncharacterized protein (TIGR01777 family)